MGKIEEISEDEIARLAQASGLYEKLPPDFVPFRPGQKQSQPAARHAWHHRSDEGDEDDEDRFVDDSDEEDEDDEQYASRSGTAQELMEAADRDGLNPTLEEVFDVIIWTMPFAFLFLMFDILIQQQYAQEPTFLGELAKMAVNVPILGAFIYFTMPRPKKETQTQTNLLQAAFFLISIFGGSSFLWIVAKSNWEIVMQRTPPLGTLWIYCIVRLQLLPACVSLLVVAAFTQFAELDLQIFPN